MRPITKIMLGIIAVGGLLQSVGFGLLLWPSREFTRFYLQQVVWLRPTMIGLTGLVALVFLIMLLVAIFRRSTARSLILAGEDGDLTLDKSAIENTVAKAVVAQHFAKSVAVAVSIRKKQVARMRSEACAGASLASHKGQSENGPCDLTMTTLGQQANGIQSGHFPKMLMPLTTCPARRRDDNAARNDRCCDRDRACLRLDAIRVYGYAAGLDLRRSRLAD